jgi:hypothetical protein
MAETREEAPLVETPCLSSAKRTFRIWIFDPYDMLIGIGFIVFGVHLFPLPLYLGGIATIFSIIAFFKYGKPDGYLFHLVKYHLRPRGYKVSQRRNVPRFFETETLMLEKMAATKTMQQEYAENEEFLRKIRPPNPQS